MCYCCKRREAVGHCITELGEMLPGAVTVIALGMAIAWNVEYRVLGSASAHSHTTAYVIAAAALLASIAVIDVLIRLQDVRFTKRYAISNDGKCYNCGKEIKDAD